MKVLENKILLTGFVAKNTLKVDSFENRVLIRFGLRLSTSFRNRETQQWEKAYATQFCYGYFPYEKAKEVESLLREDKAIVTVECRFQARCYRDVSGVERERLMLYLISVTKAEELSSENVAFDMTGATDSIEIDDKLDEPKPSDGKRKARRAKKIA